MYLLRDGQVPGLLSLADLAKTTEDKGVQIPGLYEATEPVRKQTASLKAP